MLIGRDAELAVLDALITQASTGVARSASEQKPGRTWW